MISGALTVIVFIVVAVILKAAMLTLDKKGANRKKNYAELKKVNKQKGDRYEAKIGESLEIAGYKVIYRGLELGKKDEGIDLIAENKNEIILIQCKNWKENEVTHKEIKEFLWNCHAFAKKINPDKPIKYKFFASNRINPSADTYVKQQIKAGVPIECKIAKE
jgi:restriction system protein